jgi:hypothetical protein
MEFLVASSNVTQAAAAKQLAFNNAKVGVKSVKELTLNFQFSKPTEWAINNLQKLNGKLSPELLDA